VFALRPEKTSFAEEDARVRVSVEARR